MKKIVWYSYLILLCIVPYSLWGQQEVQIGKCRFVPDQNMVVRSEKTLELGQTTNGYYNTLVQFRSIPTSAELQQLEKQGVKLGSYLGGNAYYALVSATKPKVVEALRGRSTLSSLMPLRSEWKIAPSLQEKELPEYVREGVYWKLSVHYAENISPAQAQLALQRIARGILRNSETFRTIDLTLLPERIEKLAELPWILSINPIDAPMQLNNQDASALNRVALLRSNSPLYGARQLDGEGIRIGIWDGNVMQHPDFGQRIHRQEYESQGQGSEQHGTHVAGSILGSGLLDVHAQGMAPRAEAYTYNFIGRNELSSQEEMLNAKRAFDITLTSNSYGTPLAGQCRYYKLLPYRQNDFELDILARQEPTLSHQIAAGNEQSYCSDITKERYGRAGYGTSTWRAKNVIYVGAVTPDGQVTDFSSFGPQDDGRMFPTIMAKGEQVYSTQPATSYANMRGTSMACPVASGTLALLQQYHKKLFNNKPIRNDLLKALVINTADDAGRKGPDFQYGYGILNAANAVDCMERGYLYTDSVESGKTRSFVISIPQGINYKQAKITLVWNDAPMEKALDFGEAVLVNDLDLLVDGKESYRPWVCNPAKGRVEDPAERAVDRLNNIEQVTLTKDEFGTGFTVRVSGTRIVDGRQRFALVVWFEEVKKPQIIPQSDQLTLEPGQEYVLHHQGLTGEYTVDLSYDDGKTFHFLGSVPKYNGGAQDDLIVKIPTDAPITTKGRFRIIGKDGGIAISPFPIVIAPYIKNLRIVEDACGTVAQKLTWDKLEGDIEGYTVLRINTDTETREVLTELGKEVQEYTLPTEKIKVSYYTVAVRLHDKKLGPTAPVVRSYAANKLKLGLTNLPFKENFHVFPSPYFHQSVGKNVFTIYKPYTPDFTPGNNSLIAVTRNVKDYFNDDEYFNNPTQMVTLGMCDLDLTELSTTDHVFLHVHARVADGSTDERGSARFRVVVDGLPQTPIGSATEEQHSVVGTQEYIYKIAGGKSHKVEIQFCGRLRDDNFILSGIAIDRPAPTPDIALTLLKDFSRFESPGETECRVLVENHSSTPLKNVGLRVLVDGKWVATKVVVDLLEMARTEVPIALDLRTSDPLGAIRDIQIIADNENDPTPADNVLHFSYNYRGEVLCMPEAEIEITALGKVPVDPKITIQIDSPTIFTDCGGLYGNYAEYQEATLKIVPKDPKQRVRVTFRKFETTGSNTGLFVYTSSVPHDLRLYSVPVKEILTGTLDQPVTYISEATDGAITFLFQCLYDLAPGWEAEIDFVPVANPLAITWAGAQLQSTMVETEAPVKVHLLNRWKQSFQNIRVSLWNGRNVLMDAMLPELKPGKTEFIFPKTLQLKARELKELGVFIEAEGDTEWKDNHYDVLAGFDAYCIPMSYRRFTNQWLKKIAFENREIEWTATRTHITYDLDKVLTLFKGDGKVRVKVEAKEVVTPDQTLLLYVDWNEDGRFAVEEKVHIPTQEDDIITFEIAAPDGASAGKKRARLMLVKTSELASYPCATENITTADIHDFTIDLYEGANPLNNDLMLTKVDIGSTGLNLSAEQEIKITIQNLSNANYKTKVKIHVDVDGTLSNEEYDFETTPLAPFIGKKTLTLATKANLAAKGLHKVKVTIAEQPSVVNETNNVLIGQVWCNIPETDGFYAIEMLSNTREYADEHVDLSKTADKISATSDFTIECWVNLNHPQSGYIFTSQQMRVLSLYKYTQYPDNALAILLGIGQYSLLAITPANSFMPNRWNHLALVVSDIQPTVPSSSLEVYINGKRVPLSIEGGGVPNLKELHFMPRLNARADGLRIWSRTRTEEEIRTNMYSSLASVTPPAGLEAEFMFDEGDGNSASFSSNTPAEILIHDINRYQKSAPYSVWQPNTQLFDPMTDVSFTQQIRIEKGASADEYSVIFLKGVAKQQKVQIRSVWDATSFEYEKTHGVWEALTTDTELDFTNPVKLKAKLTLFGKELEQTVMFVGKEDKSNECSIIELAIKKAQNPGLTDDVILLQPRENQEIDVKVVQNFNPGSVKLKVVLSTNAKLYYKGNEVLNGEITLDMQKPISLVTLAENEVSTKAYTIRLSLEQSIEWNFTKLEYTYGDASVRHNAKAVGGSVVFESSNPKVITVTNTDIVFSKPGESILTPHQAGTGLYKAVVGSSKKLIVKKLTVKGYLDITQLRYSEPSRWKFRYEGLVLPTDASALPAPITYYEIKDANGVSYQSTARLPIGHYTLTPKQGLIFGNEYYNVILQPAALEVVQGDWNDVIFDVRTTNGESIEAATVKFDDLQLKTGNDGRCVVPLRTGQKIRYTVTKGGYSNIAAEFVVKAGNPQVIDVVMKAAELTVTYSVENSEMGLIVGNLEQHLAKGENALPVVAIAKEEYIFVAWSDGKTEPKRLDEKVEQNLSLVAKFRKKGRFVEYELTEGGKWKKGLQIQEVLEDQETKEVEVEPLEGYFFNRWNDYKRTPNRVDDYYDLEPEGETIFTAYFDPYQTIPNVYGFENGHLVDGGQGWDYDDTEGEVCPWVVTNAPQQSVYKLDNYCAVINGYELGNQTDKKLSHLISTRFLIPEDIDTDLDVRFDYIFLKSVGAKFFWSYSFDGENWIKIGENITEAFVKRNISFRLQNAELTGKKFVQFRWTYQAKKGALVMMDNFLLAPVSTTAPILHFIASPSEAGTFVNADGLVTDLTVPYMSIPKPITAIPKLGYVFDGWGDGIKTPRRTFTKPVFVGATYTANFRKEDIFRLRYKVLPEGAGKVVSDGTALTEQLVEKGKAAKKVIAVPELGYEFVRWNDDGTTELQKTTTNIQADATIEAVFVRVQRKLTLHIVSGGKDVTKAKVFVGGKLLYADMYGKVSTLVNVGKQVYTITAEGYETKSLTLEVATEDIYLEIELTSNTVVHQYLLQFAVRDTEGALAGAKIQMGNETLVTDANGEASIALSDGTYHYKVEKEGYEPKDGDLTIEGAAKKESIELVKIANPSPEAVEESCLHAIVVAPNPFGDILRISNPVVVNVRYELLTQDGRLLFAGILAVGQNHIATDKLLPGVYILRLTYKKRQEIRPLIKE